MNVSPRRHTFVAKVINNGGIYVKIVWSGNNGCHVFQENVIKFWVALYPNFPDSYSTVFEGFLSRAQLVMRGNSLKVVFFF